MPETVEELSNTLELADKHTEMLMDRIAHLEKCILENHEADGKVIRHLEQFVDFVNLWCNRETKVSDSERLSVIKHHPMAQARLKIQPVNG